MNGFTAFVWILCGVAGYAIGKSKNRAGTGVALGLLLGVIGVVITLFLRDKSVPKYLPPTYNSPTTYKAPAGWYQDTNGTVKERYWDGNAWTNDVIHHNGIQGKEY